MIDDAIGIGEALRGELLLFAAVGLLVGGLDDLVIDLLYWLRRGWRAITVYRHTPRMTADRLPMSTAPGTLAIFVPAWDEGAVIGRMLARACATVAPCSRP